jgi:hypothetical protein
MRRKFDEEAFDRYRRPGFRSGSFMTVYDFNTSIAFSERAGWYRKCSRIGYHEARAGKGESRTPKSSQRERANYNGKFSVHFTPLERCHHIRKTCESARPQHRRGERSSTIVYNGRILLAFSPRSRWRGLRQPCWG